MALRTARETSPSSPALPGGHSVHRFSEPRPGADAAVPRTPFTYTKPPGDDLRQAQELVVMGRTWGQLPPPCRPRPGACGRWSTTAPTSPAPDPSTNTSRRGIFGKSHSDVLAGDLNDGAVVVYHDIIGVHAPWTLPRACPEICGMHAARRGGG